MKKGYAGIALFEPKNIENLGTIFRSAHCFGFDYISIIGGRYKRQASDTTDAGNHLPIFQYANFESFRRAQPENVMLIGVEVNGKSDLKTFAHPKQAVYIFGGEDRTIQLTNDYHHSIRLKTSYCLNLAVCASIVMYDRTVKLD
jgi:tRNA(Leu) C34 or U34 (ribose-2'-O)-methylase TrmL